jgi:hypothetical protein
MRLLKLLFGAGNRNRTDTALRPRVFETRASACSATPARNLRIECYHMAPIIESDRPARCIGPPTTKTSSGS